MIRVLFRSLSKSKNLILSKNCIKGCQHCKRLKTHYNSNKLNDFPTHFSRNTCTSARNLADQSLSDKILEPLKLEHTENPLDKDEYIQPYNVNNESIRTSNKLAVASLERSFNMTPNEIEKLLTTDVKKRNIKDLNKIIYVLLKFGIKKNTVLNYPWVLTKDATQINNKLEDLKTLGLPNIEDLVPFLQISYKRLARLVLFLKRESNLRGIENRIEFISRRLNVDIKTVCLFLSQRLFMLEMPFDILCENLDHMIGYGVQPINVLKDLWAFRYTPNSVKSRLERAKVAKKDKIMPWMVRCPESILERSLQLSMDEKNLLGDKTVIQYVAKRLDFDEEVTKAIMLKHPAVLKVRVTKIKEVLDYLLIEAGISKYDVANVPRILCHGLETTKHRLEELRAVGCNPSSLVILCRSKREYEKFLRNWTDIHKKCIDKKNVQVP